MRRSRHCEAAFQMRLKQSDTKCHPEAKPKDLQSQILRYAQNDGSKGLLRRPPLASLAAGGPNGLLTMTNLCEYQ